MSGGAYASFWQAGFEGADHINGSATPLCMNSSTGHLDRAEDDYARMRVLGLRVARESAGWRRIARGPRFDFESVLARQAAANRQGVQLLWTCFHYGLPDGLDIFSERFIHEFADYTHAMAAALRPLHPTAWAPVYTPINEISFLTWAVCETGLLHPHRGDRACDGAALKRHLVRAALAANEAIHAADPRARILAIDPLIHVAADSAQDADEAAFQHEAQFEAWDMLAGRREPSLGGSERALDLIGVNYYPHNQWLARSRDVLAHDDPRRRPFSALLAQVHARYRRPLVVSETSHVDEMRGPWLTQVAQEVADAIDLGADVQGVCLYPALDRPDWEQPDDWHRSGLWRVEPSDPSRTLEHHYAAALAQARRHLSPTSKDTAMDTLIVFSYLRWDFVYQRPQHLLSRLAARWNVIVLEEPVPGEQTSLSVSQPAPGVTVLRPHTQAAEPGFSDAQFPELSALLGNYLAENAIERYGVWLYTPMALPLLGGLSPQVIVYDCMDELSLFRFAPPQLLRRERDLLRIASVVFTGGPSLYDAKRDHAHNVHSLPSSVDAAHFARGADPANADPRFDALPRPRLGYYGVIDERIDLDLVAAVADANPQWQVCMVGPVVKIDPASLPQRANLHWFPSMDYAELPGALAAWDVCLMPFALNPSTRFISPTKTLEYMAAGKPVVSTRIRDVERLYAEGVAIADDAAGFVRACESLLAETDAARQRRQAMQARLVAATSWDLAAARVVDGIEQALETGLGADAQRYLAEDRIVVLPRRSEPRREVECLIIGAGPTGLSAALHAGPGSVLVERNATVGGWCRSIQDRGYTFDYAGHIMFSKDPYVLKLYEALLGENLHWQDREAWVYSKGVHTRYPFQGALYGLPPDVLKECLVGAIEARFGPLSAKEQTPAAPAKVSALATGRDRRRMPEDCCADGVLPSAADGDVKDAAPAEDYACDAPANFEDFIYRTWGSGVAKHFAIPYNRKLWTVPLDSMETSWLGGRVPLPDLEQMIEGALQPVAKPVGPNARFGYPKEGGFQALMDGFLPLLEGELKLSTSMEALDVAGRVARLSDGSVLHYDSLISTMPLPELMRLIGEQAPAHVREAVAGLRHVSIRCVNLGVARENITDKHWIYYPEDTVFHRIFVQGNASPANNPQGGFGLTCEISYSPHKPLPCEGQALIDLCIADCRRVGMLREDDEVPVSNEVDMPYAYVIYDHARQANVTTIRQWLGHHGIVLAGRYSEWEYYNSDHAFLAGRKGAAAVRALAATGTES